MKAFLLFAAIIFVTNAEAKYETIECSLIQELKPALRITFQENSMNPKASVVVSNLKTKKKIEGTGHLDLIRSDDSDDGYVYLYSINLYNSDQIYIMSNGLDDNTGWVGDYYTVYGLYNYNCKIVSGKQQFSQLRSSL